MTWEELISNQILLASLVAWLLAQTLKVVVVLLREKRLELRWLIRSGGMPSSHTALVCALVTSVGITQGLSSPLFAITVVVAMVVIYDATGVRRAVGRQSIILDRIVGELTGRHPRLREVQSNIRILLGHTPVQVFSGAILGISVGWFWMALMGLVA